MTRFAHEPLTLPSRTLRACGGLAVLFALSGAAPTSAQDLDDANHRARASGAAHRTADHSRHSFDGHGAAEARSHRGSRESLTSTHARRAPAARALDRATLQGPSASGPAALWSDDFDRPNSTRMGTDWQEYIGDQLLLDNHGMGNVPNNFAYMLHNSASLSPASARMEVDLLPPSGSGGPHVALIAGAQPGSYQWFYTKIQDGTNDGVYDRIYFYSFSNGVAWGSTRFQDLTRPISTGRVAMYFTNGGDTLNVDIDADFDGTVDQRYSNSGALAVPVAGTRFGIGTWAMGAYDNWRVTDCPPASLRTYGTGLAGTLGVPPIAASGRPGLGTLVQVGIGNSLGAPSGVAAVFGGAAASIPGFWGGTLLVTPDVLHPAPIPAGGLSLPLFIPADPNLCSRSLFVQGLVLDPGARRGIANTQGLELVLGF